MAWTQTDVETLEQAIRDRKGARSIAFSDQVVTFESIKDMRDLLAEMRRAAAAGGGSRTRYAATSKGV